MMTIQSLSIVVPSKACVNDCKFCVAKMHTESVPDMMNENLPFYDLYEKDYIRRLEFARDNGCNTMMITGDVEPQQNRGFLQKLGTMNNNLSKPFRWIEMQTTGVNIDDAYLRFLRNHVSISTISVSLSSFSSAVNATYNGTKSSNMVDLITFCRAIKKYDFNLRLSVNMTDCFNTFKDNPGEFFKTCKEDFKADQVTLRLLYESEHSEQAEWVRKHAAKPETILSLNMHILKNGRKLERLEYGRVKYSVEGMSIVVDDDCMGGEAKQELKYVILRPNCKLYSKWDDMGSLIF